jgi:DNA-binding GntR family transcriptional regulator
MLAEKTYKSLKTMIYRRELEPGQRLIERKLSLKLGVSRVPLRESLVRLESEGLVKRVPYGPSQVMDFSKTDVVEMYSMRLLLEPFATRLAALNHEPSLIRHLKRLCKSMTRASKSEAWAEMDRTDCEFHHAIVEASGNKSLLQAYENCHIQIGGMLSNFSHMVAGEPPETNARQHIPLIEALEKRDPDQAGVIAFDHVKDSVDKIQECFGIWLTPKQKPLFEHLPERSIRKNGL